MEQLLAVWVESLPVERGTARRCARPSPLADALEEMCPFSEVVRLGLFVMPLKGPSRFFGGDEAVVRMVRQCVGDVSAHPRNSAPPKSLFCAELAAHREVLVPRGQSDRFRRAQPLEVLGRKDLAATRVSAWDCTR